MADKFSDRKGVDPVTGMREENYKGIVTSDRKLKPAYWNVKMVYSPVTIAARTVAPTNGHCFVTIQNRYAFTDLSELTCRWQMLAGGKELRHGENHIACRPGKSIDAIFPASTGMDALRIEFIHPDGRSIYLTTLRTPAYQTPVAPPALVSTEPLRLAETDSNVITEAAGTRLELSKQSGQILSWRVGDQELMLGGPVLNLGEGLWGAAARPRSCRGGPISNSHPPLLTNAVVTASMEGTVAKISVATDFYLAGTNAFKGQLQYLLTIDADAQVDVAWRLTWQGATNATALEAGLKFLLPASLDRMAWVSENLWTEYPSNHIGNPMGFGNERVSFPSAPPSVTPHWLALSGQRKVLSGRAPQPTSRCTARGRADANGTVLFLEFGSLPSRPTTAPTLCLVMTFSCVRAIQLAVVSACALLPTSVDQRS